MKTLYNFECALINQGKLEQLFIMKAITLNKAKQNVKSIKHAIEAEWSIKEIS